MQAERKTEEVNEISGKVYTLIHSQKLAACARP